MYIALLHEAGADLSSLRWCVSGGAPMPAEVMAEFEARFGVTLLEGYGLSETSPVASFTVPDRPRTPGSIGYPVPGVEMTLIDGEDLRARASAMKGYGRNSRGHGRAIVDGWSHRRHRRRRRARAYRIVDRKKDLIIRGGYNVYPREVEEVLHRHPAVAQAAVVGIPHPPTARMSRPSSPSSPAPRPHPTRSSPLTRHLSYKRPRTVEIRASLPVGPTGKVLKDALRHPELAEVG